MLRTPRKYQVDGISWLTTPNVHVDELDKIAHPDNPTLCRHMLTDAPGAGKSFQATEAANILLSQHPTHSACIIAPAHLCKQWYDFVNEQYASTPESKQLNRVVWFEGTKTNKLKDAKTHARWYIISTQSFRHKHYLELYTQLFIDNHVDVVIIDESHYCKNVDASQSKNIRAITRPGFVSHVIELTATPVVREADDLYMQLRILDPVSFHKQDVFLNTYCWFTWTSWGAQDVQLRKDAPKRLEQWMLGRSYKEIGLEIPPIIAEVHAHKMIEQRAKAYTNIKTFWWTLIDNPQYDKDGNAVLSANSAMQVMHMLRHIISSPEKQQDLMPFMATDPGPYVIFCFYRESVKDLCNKLREYNPALTVTPITGETPSEQRIELAKKHCQLPTDVIVATIPAVPEGADLSAANTVYYYEEDFTPGKMYQTLSRVRRHRGNDDGTSVTITEDNHLHVDENPNERPVIVRYFHADRTIDQHIHAVQTNRAVNVRDLVKVELGV